MARTTRLPGKVAGALLVLLAACSSGSSDPVAAPEPGVVITAPATLPAANLGQSYSFAFTANPAGEGQWSVVAGEVPSGLALDPATGRLGGSPTATGATAFTVQVDGSLGSATKDCAIAVIEAPTILTVGLPDAAVGVAYTQALYCTGSTPRHWSVVTGNLPAGMSLGESTGVLSGTPTTAGTAPFRIALTNAAGTAQQLLSLAVATSPQAPTITTTSPLPDATIGSAYAVQLAATGTTPIAWSLTQGTLPTGLDFGEDGALTGTPTAIGSSTFTLSATNEVGAADRTVSLAVVAAPTLTAITPANAPRGAIVDLAGTGFSTNVAENVVTFDGITSPVLAATATSLRVEVPQVTNPTVEVMVAVQRSQGASVSGTLNYGVDLATHVVFVDPGATGVNDGTSWRNAFPDLYLAMPGAQAGDEIWVVGATYAPWQTMTVPASVSVYGGFTGQEGLRNQRAAVSHETRIVCFDANTPAVELRGSATLDGFFFAGNDEAHAIQVNGVGVHIAATTFDHCYTDTFGAAVDMTSASDVTVTDCRFSYCMSADRGALYGRGFCTMTVDACVFVGCECYGTILGGGAVCAAYNANITNCLFVGNYAHMSGGAVHVGTNSSLRNCSFYGNYSGNNGDSMHAGNSGITVRDCVFAYGGSFVHISGSAGMATVSTCLIDANGLGSQTNGGGNLLGVAAGFVDTNDLAGPDGIWGTRDDGLMPAANGNLLDVAASGGPDHDLTGTARPQGNAADLGAYER